MLVVDVRDVDWVEARDNYVAVHAGAAVHTTRGTLGGLVGRLDPSRFVRIHRSTVVNLERVRELQPWFQGELVALLKDGTRLAVGPTYREAFLRRLRGGPPEA